MSIVLVSNKATKELEKTKNNIKNNNPNLTFAKKYLNSGFIPFTLTISTNDDGKKKLEYVPAFSNIDKNNCLEKLIKKVMVWAFAWDIS